MYNASFTIRDNFQFFPILQNRMRPLSLESRGIYMSLWKDMNFEKELESANVKYGSFSRSQGRFEFPSGDYTVGPLLGKGSYGETLQAVHTTENTVCAVKILDMKKTRNQYQFIRNTIKESVINILLEKASENEPTGPFVPRFYEMAIDPTRDLLLIRQERLHGTLADIYDASTKEQNDFTVPETLGDMAYVLNFFYKEFEFNHRDLKSDNVMYTFSSTNKPLVKLIDFGFSCLTWNGVKIAGTHYFPLEAKCFVPSRDLTQFIYEIWYSFRSRFSNKIQQLLQELLTFPTGKRMCRLFEGCKYKGTDVRGWGGELYDFLNLPDVQNPQAVPSILYRRMSEYLGRGSPKKITPLPPIERTETGKVKRCLPEQILNPRTRRCVRRSGKLGRKLMIQTDQRSPSPRDFTFFPITRKRPCPSGKSRNPRTNRCRFRCPSSMIRNPKTQRCVSRVGPVGRRILGEGAKTSPHE
jgi:serine/threonine protein kinase